MIYGLIILALIVVVIGITSKSKEDLKKSYSRLIFVLLGMVSFYLFIRILPPLMAILSSVFVAIIPLLGKILRLASFAAIFKGTTGAYKEKSKESKMTVEEACDILGVDKNATKSDINRAYRAKMKEHHPDHGGSNYFADKLTSAKNILLEGK